MSVQKKPIKVSAKEANAASKKAVTEDKKNHKLAARLHAAYADQLADRMSARGQGFSHTLGYHSDMETYHKLRAKGQKATPPLKYNPRNDPSSMSFRFKNDSIYD